MVIVFGSFERLADDGPPEMLWVYATVSIFLTAGHFCVTFYQAGLHLVSRPGILVPGIYCHQTQ